MTTPKQDKKKTRMISMRVTDAQFQKFEDMINRIQGMTGFRVNRTSMILMLMQYGLPELEKKYPNKDLALPTTHKNAG